MNTNEIDKIEGGILSTLNYDVGAIANRALIFLSVFAGISDGLEQNLE